MIKKKRVIFETTDGKTHFADEPIKSMRVCRDYTVLVYVGGYRETHKTNTLSAIHVATAKEP